ncbi:hypothetical protein [Trabulsiella odontotermitis]|uniref:hypothetical protein n=1 Tax=Trabulsiella odontotermitis TaxID=379893 RepID=UPI0006766EF1|nr:hypothetical protein [Trabulsiella odontotermitis]KNC89774.1 hypothetical protein GM30_05160 [Trabulsiella odontotermitis]
MIMDIYSRKIIAAEIFSSETGEHAAELLQRAVWNEKCSSHNNADVIAIMLAKAVKFNCDSSR